MKKSCLLASMLFCCTLLSAETVKLKDGTFVSGSVTSQTEYTLNLNTSYGPVVINQREVEAILPDKHRVYLKGGTQLIGVIVDLDEFNMKLQTDEGVVNIDMPQIVSVEVYDYDQGDAAKKAVAEKQAAQQAAAQAQAAREAAASSADAANTAAPAPDAAAGGLSFDSDIEKVFDVKKPEIINGQVQTVQEISAAQLRAQQAAQMSEEEAFIKGVTPAQRQADVQAIEKTAEAARSGKLEQIKKAEAKKAKRPKDSATDKYFAISVGAQTDGLKLDNTSRAGYAGTSPYDVGGTGIRAEAAFLWRVKGSNLWLGPAAAITNIPNSSFTDLDPTVVSTNQAAAAKGEQRPYDPDVTTSGQIIDLMLKANYYFTPESLFAFYVTASAGYRMLSLNYRGGIQSDSLSSDTFAGAAGVGVEMHVDDLMLGLEVQEFYSPYSGDLKDSDAANTVASVKFSWKF